MGPGRLVTTPRARDVAVAAAVAGSSVLTWAVAERSAAAPDAVAYALLAAGGLALAAGRRAPVGVLVVTGLLAVTHRAVGVDVPAVAFLFAVYAAMRSGHRLATAAVSVTVLAAFPLVALLAGDDPAGAFAQARGALELAWLLAAAAAGEALRQAEQRAEEAERGREQAARRRADEERLRIARELHDSLTHQISIIKVQADVAVHVARRRGEQVPEAVLAIQDAGREAMRELRTTLSALRDDGTAPPRGLDDVPALVERTRTLGLQTSLTIHGERRDLPSAVGTTAYRIVQEALTNTARHAGATTASVRIDCRPTSMAIRVDDDGRTPPGAAPVAGAGLLGMQERVAALGGRLSAGARDHGGFTVQAELPVDRTP